MIRRDFIKITALVGASLTTSFLQAQDSDMQDGIMYLTGQKRPALFGDNYNLRKEASEAFSQMRKDALKDGIQLYSQSSYRSFDHQKSIWERKYARFTGNGMSGEEAIKEIIKYSTIPGTSRHHWGTDLDIIDLNVPQPSDVLISENFISGGAYEKMYLWMNKHANSYGFYESYTDDENRKGFEYEPWHYSYKPLSKVYLKKYLSVDLTNLLKSLTISGSTYFTQDFIEMYKEQNIKGINKILL